MLTVNTWDKRGKTTSNPTDALIFEFICSNVKQWNQDEEQEWGLFLEFQLCDHYSHLINSWHWLKNGGYFTISHHFGLHPFSWHNVNNVKWPNPDSATVIEQTDDRAVQSYSHNPLFFFWPTFKSNAVKLLTLLLSSPSFVFKTLHVRGERGGTQLSGLMEQRKRGKADREREQRALLKH